MGESRLKVATKQSTVARVAALTDKKPRIQSASLFQGKSEVVIVHQKEEYNLRITRNGKLILTK
jgi:hemin uptake protein HemP